MAGVATEQHIRAAVKTLKIRLQESIGLRDILDELFSTSTINMTQYQELQQCDKQEGSINAMSKLIMNVMGKEVSTSGFLEVLKKGQLTSWAYTEILERAEKIKKGEWTSPDLQEIQKHLKVKYTEELSDLEAIPGEDFRVKLADPTMMMRPQFTAEEVDFESKKNRQFLSAFGKMDPDKEVYKQLSVSELQSIFKRVGKVDTKAKNVQKELIWMVGDPGVGKTTAAQRLTWDWANGEGFLAERYTLVFYIKVRDIRAVRGVSLESIITDLKLLPPGHCEGLQAVTDHCEDVLFILDGLDEADNPADVDRLIRGDLCPRSTVFITARPEAAYFQSLTLLPRIKVTLSGTDEETVARYMRDAMFPSTDEEWTDFQGKYKEKLHDESLLYIPLYLTLLCAVFRDHIVSGLWCANLRLPESATQLFNVFMLVILKRWHARTSPNEVGKLDINFDRSPLDPESTVPFLMKSFLRSVGKMCFDDLHKSSTQYQFTDREIRQYLLDGEIMKVSGLFNIGQSGGQEVFFLKHKQLQEYLAALYLSHEGVTEYKFHNLLYSEENKGQCLSLVLRDAGLMKVVQFVCGLSGKFLADLLSVAASQFSIMRSSLGQIDLYYEAALFIEHNVGNLSAGDPTRLPGLSDLKHILCHSPIKQVSEQKFNFLLGETSQTTLSFYHKSLCKILPLFSTDLSVHLLSRFYALRLTPVTSDQSSDYMIHAEGRSSPVTKLTLCLDQLQSELLGGVRVLGVKRVVSVGCDTSYRPPCYVDLPALLGTFPHLRQLRVDGDPYIPYSSDVRSHREMSTSLTRVILWNPLSSTVTLPDSHITSLMQQAALTHLELDDVIPLTTLTASTGAGHSLWPVLTRLILTADLGAESGDTLTHVTCLLEGRSDTLEECWLTVYSVEKQSVREIEEALMSLRRVQVLFLYISLSPSLSSPVSHEMLPRVLPHLPRLHTLKVDYGDVKHSLPDVVEAVCSHGGIHTLWLRKLSADSDDSDDSDAQLPTDLTRRLHDNNVKVTWW